jgi:glycosyltransferase involved in cell wall biosynthesis
MQTRINSVYDRALANVNSLENKNASLNFRSLRVGYVPYDRTLQMPGDRYRFCYYAKKRNIAFEIADPAEQYDLLVVSSGADLSVWRRYRKGKARIVFQYINSYLSEGFGSPKRVFRGLAKFLVRQNRYLLADYCSGIRDMCQLADAVVCTTPQQQQDVSELCANNHVILDSYEPLVRSTKTDYSGGEIANLVWQGFPENMRFFGEIREVLKRVQRSRKLAFHLITHLEYGQYLGRRVRKRRALDVAREFLDNVYLYEWNEDTCSSIITACDLALIPIPLGEAMEAGKPENKLLLFWRLGMPTIVSSTPAYARAMRQCGLAMDCQNEQEWEEILLRFMGNEEVRRHAGQKGKSFAEKYFGAERILEQWDAVFLSLLERDKQDIADASLRAGGEFRSKV